MKNYNLFVFGQGYTSSSIIATLKKKGWDIKGTRRSGAPPEVYEFSQDQPLNRDVFKGVTHILCSIPPVEGEDLVLKHHREELLKVDTLQWVGYLSTTSVYGDHQGGWVDEKTPPNPSHQRSEARLRSENGYLELWRTHNIPAHIFRLSGIYGPNRSVFERLKTEKPHCIHKPNQVFSRIHVEDISQTLIKSMENPTPGEIYNLADDLPTSNCDVMDYGAKLLGIRSPNRIPYDPEALSEMARTFYQDCRRVRNDKIKRTLGVELLYPDYRVGLKKILEDTRAP